MLTDGNLLGLDRFAAVMEATCRVLCASIGRAKAEVQSCSGVRRGQGVTSDMLGPAV